jgi:tellurite resistance protein
MRGDDLGLVRALGFVAWADDRIAPEERQMLETVMNAVGVPEARRDELCKNLKDGPATLEEISSVFTDDTERRFAIAQAILMARADGDFADVERDKIAELAAALGIDPDELSMLYAAVDVTDSLMVPPSE